VAYQAKSYDLTVFNRSQGHQFEPPPGPAAASGGATPTMGTDGSPHGGTPARESHARSVVVAINYNFVRTVSRTT